MKGETMKVLAIVRTYDTILYQLLLTSIAAGIILAGGVL